MSEETARQMEFIINQQAQFSVDILKLHDALATEAASRKEETATLFKALGTVVALIGTQSEALEEMRKQQEEMRKQQLEMRQQHAETVRKLDETGERLDVFINVLERYLSEGRNGKKDKAE